MSKPRVTYFDFPGSRGEEVRLALVLAGVDFDDNRIDHETFANLKGDLPFPYLPTFEMDGHEIVVQTNAILRLIGRLHGLYPDDPHQAVRHDALMDAVEDLRHRISPTTRMTDPAQKKAARQLLERDFIPHWARGVERLIGQGPFVGGARPGVADIKLYMAHRWISSSGIDDISRDVFAAYPKLAIVASGVKAEPSVAAWYKAAN